MLHCSQVLTQSQSTRFHLGVLLLFIDVKCGVLQYGDRVLVDLKPRVIIKHELVLSQLASTPYILCVGLNGLELLLNCLLVLLIPLTDFHIFILGLQSPVNCSLLFEIEEGICIATEPTNLVPNVLLMLFNLNPVSIADVFRLLLNNLTQIFSLRIQSFSLQSLFLELLLLLQDIDLEITWLLVLRDEKLQFVF